MSLSSYNFVRSKDFYCFGSCLRDGLKRTHLTEAVIANVTKRILRYENFSLKSDEELSYFYIHLTTRLMPT